MTTITVPRALLEQALEALKSVQDHRPNDETNNAITALRAALAQQAEPGLTHRINSWGFCGVCRHDRIPGEGCARQECPDSPQRKPLTDDEIPALAEKAWKPSVYYDAKALLGTDGLVALARAVEAKHNIKE
jgi:hypothetical protein